MNRSVVALPLVACMLASQSLVTWPAHAQGATNAAAAEALYEEGKNLLTAGETAEACRKFEASLDLDEGVGTLLYLGECYARDGRTASAWATFLEAASLAQNTGQQERETVARQRAAELEGRLVKLQLDVSAANDDVSVKLNNRAIPKASWGIPLPVDPGTQRITATAPGKQPWTQRVELAEDAPTTRVEVPPLRNAVPEPQAATSDPPGSQPTPQDSRTKSETGASQRLLGLAVSGVGVVGLGVGTYFGLSAIDDNDASQESCTNDLCNERGLALRNDALDAAGVSTVAFIAGSALVAGGLVLYLTAPDDTSTHSQRPQLLVGAAAAPGAAGLWIRGEL